jgi:hypothetical protein
MALATIRGLVRAGVVTDPRGFDVLDDHDCREWLVLNGADPASVDSGYLRALYDLVFAYEDGDVNRPRIAAGVALRCMVRAFFTYRGAFFWRMQAGMGDVVFAPFYEVLRRRGVRFEFFHRLRHVGLSAARAGERRTWPRSPSTCRRARGRAALRAARGRGRARPVGRPSPTGRSSRTANACGASGDGSNATGTSAAKERPRSASVRTSTSWCGVGLALFHGGEPVVWDRAGARRSNVRTVMTAPPSSSGLARHGGARRRPPSRCRASRALDLGRHAPPVAPGALAGSAGRARVFLRRHACSTAPTR